MGGFGGRGLQHVRVREEATDHASGQMLQVLRVHMYVYITYIYIYERRSLNSLQGVMQSTTKRVVLGDTWSLFTLWFI